MSTKSDSSCETVSLRRLIAGFRGRILGTWLLVMIEAGLMLMFPMVIGIAVDGVLQQAYSGVYLLGFIGGLTVVAGAARRFYDTRLYAAMYATAAEQIVTQERSRDAGVSIISARTGMAKELVEFLESSFPAIIDGVIALTGTLVMVWLLQSQVFAACLVATGIIGAVYALTGNRTYSLNAGANDESEKSVQIISEGMMPGVRSHFDRLMQWNIRLSDLETVTFSVSWLVMIAVLLFSVVATIQSGVTAQGQVLSILMYVFGYIESVITLPLFYQQFVRLQEISGRLEAR